MDFMSVLKNLGNQVVNSFDPLNLFNFGQGNSSSSSDFGTGSILGDTWDKLKNGNTNDINYLIAKKNLEYQKERNQIEDERYEEETAYNRAFAEEDRDYQRAFAEDERDYNRALQQQLFEREDTALERQASSLSSMGINPLSQQLNGLGAGQAVTSSAPAPSGSPSASARSGTALHNDFQYQSSGMVEALGSMLGLADTINGVKTGQYTRDSLALQNDRQYLENLKIANSLGIKYNGLLPPASDGGYINFKKSGYHLDYNDPSIGSLFESDDYKSASGSEWRKMRKDSMPSWQYVLDSFGQSDVYNQAEKALTSMSNLFDKASSNLWSKSIYELGENNNKFNPFTFILHLFGF